MASSSSSSSSQTPAKVRTINTYYENWLLQLQTFLEKLNALIASSDGNFSDEEEEEQSSLMIQVADHYYNYYQQKFKVSNGDAYLLSSLPWYTSLERTFLWVGGFRPSMLFSVVNNSVGSELSAEQVEKLEILKSEKRRKEKEIEMSMAEVQDSVAAPAITELLKREAELVDGEVSELDEVMEDLKKTMMSVIETAEDLRMSTARKVLDILRPKQAVKLLAAVAMFHLQARKLGLKKDAESAKMHGII